MTGRTGLVVALQAEAALLARRPATGQLQVLAEDSCLYLGGMGPVAARRAALALLDAGATRLAVFGVAGALVPALTNGTLLCPARICGGKAPPHATDDQWRRQLLERLARGGLPAHGGDLLGSATALTSTASKQAAARHYSAVAVDMESLAVAEVAASHGVPFIVLRAVADECADSLPAALVQAVDAFGRPRPLQLAAALLRHPALLGQLPRLATRMNGALKALRAAHRVAGNSLAAI